MNMKALENFLVTQWKLLGVLVLVAAIGLVGSGVYREKRAATEKKALSALYAAQVKVRELVAQKKFVEASAALEPVTREHAGTRAAYEAWLQLGDLAMDSADAAKAAEYYEAASKAAEDDFSKGLASYSAGIARETAGDAKAALGHYEGVLSAKGADALRPELLLAAARANELLGNSARAIELYKQVQEKFSAKPFYSGAANIFEKQLQEKNP